MSYNVNHKFVLVLCAEFCNFWTSCWTSLKAVVSNSNKIVNVCGGGTAQHSPCATCSPKWRFFKDTTALLSIQTLSMGKRNAHIEKHFHVKSQL